MQFGNYTIYIISVCIHLLIYFELNIFIIKKYGFVIWFIEEKLLKKKSQNLNVLVKFLSVKIDHIYKRKYNFNYSQ